MGGQCPGRQEAVQRCVAACDETSKPLSARSACPSRSANPARGFYYSYRPSQIDYCAISIRPGKTNECLSDLQSQKIACSLLYQSTALVQCSHARLLSCIYGKFYRRYISNYPTDAAATFFSTSFYNTMFFFLFILSI